MKQLLVKSVCFYLLALVSMSIAFKLDFFNKIVNEKENISYLSITDFTKIKTSTKASKSKWFARIFDENVYLYVNPINRIEDNVFFILQPSYFVELIEDSNTAFYKAKYIDIEGYVKKNEVQVVAYPPQKPYADNINFRVFNNSSQIMRTIPTSSGGSSTQVCYLPLFTQDVVFYGKIFGESAIPERTNIWYYCKYTLDKAYYGYIYSDGCDLMSEIPINTEECIYINSPDFSQPNQEAELSVIKKNERNYTLIILLISIPVAIFLVMLIKSNIILKLNKKEKAKEVKLFFDS